MSLTNSEVRKLIMENGTSMTINEIASAAGYSSRTSFNRNFKESTGFTPSEYLLRYHGTTVPDDDA
ncbi:MAG: Bacterial regulatory helix-turn-helix protein AraC family [Bacteroidota bacterium]|jgi:AraC-like DNA-binding protein